VAAASMMRSTSAGLSQEMHSITWLLPCASAIGLDVKVE
jgi:hypothetical protein